MPAIAASAVRIVASRVRRSGFFDATPAMFCDLQSWLAHPETNCGWMLLSLLEAENFSARRFASREDMYRAPKLQVDFFTVKFDVVAVTGGVVSLTFTAEAGWPCAVEFCESLGPGGGVGWQTLTNVPAPEATGSRTVFDAAGGNQRYYRLALP